MITLLSGTQREGSRSRLVTDLAYQQYRAIGEAAEIIDLRDLPLQNVPYGSYSKEDLPTEVTQAIEKIDNSDGLVIVVPEYNGSMPGILKYFIDFWSFPRSFEFRPVALIGLGGRFGGLRPVEHLQGVLSYRNAFIYPQRIFLTQVWDQVDEKGQLKDEKMMQIMRSQAEGFARFVRALKKEGLHANMINPTSSPS